MIRQIDGDDSADVCVLSGGGAAAASRAGAAASVTARHLGDVFVCSAMLARSRSRTARVEKVKEPLNVRKSSDDKQIVKRLAEGHQKYYHKTVL